MLERLGQRKIPSGGTLRDALAYIAAMHAEGLEFLCRPVLANALSCPIGKLHHDVLAPLGQEAAATTTSSFIFTRHRRIAKAIVSVLEDTFADDLAARYVELGKAGVDCVLRGGNVANLIGWRYTIAKHFFENGQENLALNIARGVLSLEPRNGKTLVSVASLYRKAKSSEKAVELFRGIPASVRMHRAFYFEWAVAEGLCGNLIADSILAAFSISDDCATEREDNDGSIIILTGLCIVFHELFKAHREVSFRDARIAVAVIGQQLNLAQRNVEHFGRHLAEAKSDGAKVPTVEEAFALFSRGVATAEALGVDDVVAAVIPDAANLDFNGLKRLIHASIEAKER